jgi:dihydrofolate synthase/folylpolyglutamate synthase
MLSLGNTIEAIAGEKAGIIKDNGCVVTSPQVPEALEVIRNKCAEKKARLFEVGRDIRFEKVAQPSAAFNVSGLYGNYENLSIPLIGDHQLINAATAVGALELLRHHGFIVSAESIRAGLGKIKWHARVEVIQREPTIILDVAHNAASAEALRKAIESNFSYEKLILILGTSMHKDVKGMARHLCPIADEVILTKVNNPRAVEPEDIKAEIMDECDDAIITYDTTSALAKAKSIAGARDLICVTGSVYLAGEVMHILKETQSGNAV